MRARSGSGLSGASHSISALRLPTLRLLTRRSSTLRPGGRSARRTGCKTGRRTGLLGLACLLILGMAQASMAQTAFPRARTPDVIAPPPSSSQSTRRSSGLLADPDAGPLSGQGYLQVIRLGPAGALSLREGPGTEYGRLTVLPGDAVGLRPLDAFGRWARVQYCGFEGWVAASFTAPMDSQVSPLHECERVGPLGLNSDPAAVGSATRLALAPLNAGLTAGLSAGLGQGFSEGELKQIARDEFDLPIRETASGRPLGQAPSKDPYLDCIYEAEQDRDNEIVCVQAALRSWQVAMADALERHRQLARSTLSDLERSQAAWRSYAQGTCDDFALADAPPVLKSHRATCQLMFTRSRTLELEQLLIQRDTDCRLCKRALVEAETPEGTDRSVASEAEGARAAPAGQDGAQASN